MAFQSLSSELTALIQDSKRRNPELRTAAEKSLADLKGLPSTSDSQLAADLRKRPLFIKPFLLGCVSKNQKLAASSIACLQRLINIKGLHQDAVREVLDGLRDSASLSQDVQLKILQLLPALLQNYGGLVLNELLATALQICFLLLASKNGIISNTAAATLQQVVISVFDRVVAEDRTDPDVGLIQDLPTETGSISVRQAALDAHRVLNDLCLLTDGAAPEFLVATQFQPNFGLELIESILANHASIVVAHQELVHVLRTKLLPFVIRALSEKASFPIVLRALRLLPVIFTRMLDTLNTECEMVLGLVNHMLDPDAGVLWKRILCMELLRSLHGDHDLIRQIFSRFDEKEGRRNIIQDQMAVMVRLASEKPAVIGLGQQSSAPYSSGQAEDEADQMAALQAEGISGTIGVAMTVKSSTAHGISVKLSNIKTPCLEQLDKSEPPSLPPSYLYSLTLTCLNNFSEGLGRFLLPFTVPQDGKQRRKAAMKDNDRVLPGTSMTGTDETPKKAETSRYGSDTHLKVPVNPLDLKASSEYDQIVTCSSMVSSCWPALLAAYSTFFHAALDSEYYRGLVRSFQKFAQVAGLLRLKIPQDAFLTTLSKNAMPSGPISLLNPGTTELVFSSSRDAEQVERADSPEISEKPKASTDELQASLNARNLLCLRALLNLGIALGPVLQKAWTIILEALQQADFLISHVTVQRRKLRAGSGSHDEAEYLADVGNEIAAVAAAASRLFESTSDLATDSYKAVIFALCGLFRDLDPTKLQACGAYMSDSRLRSQQSTPHTQIYDPRLNGFVIETLMKVVQSNEQRFLRQTSSENGWLVMTNCLKQVIIADYLEHDIRIRAAKAILTLVVSTANPNISSDFKEEIRLDGLSELHSLINSVCADEKDAKAVNPCEETIQLLGLESLHSMLELYGDNLASGWAEIFEIILTVFVGNALDKRESSSHRTLYPPGVGSHINPRSLKLMRSSFASLQLICSDFLPNVPQTCTTTLIVVVRYFVEQREDFNLALTALPLHVKVADFIWENSEHVQLHKFKNVDSDQLGRQSSNIPDDVLLLLMLSLVSISTDERPEIRHGAIHISYQIIDSHADDLSDLDWFVYIKLVTLSLFKNNETAHSASIDSKNAESKLSNTWIETTTLLLNNTSGLLNLCLRHLVHTEGFIAVWSRLIQHLNSYISWRSLSLSSAVFDGLEKTLAAFATLDLEQTSIAPVVDPVWQLWMAGNPARHTDNSRNGSDNQTALSSYLSCFIELHRLDQSAFDLARVEEVVQQIYNCAEQSSPMSYAADLDMLSPLQKEVVEAIETLDTTRASVLKIVVSGVSSLVRLPFAIVRDDPAQKGPTFVALAKRCMGILESQLTGRNDDAIEKDPEILRIAVSAFRAPISRKYVWAIEGKDVLTWRKATSALLNILRVNIPQIERNPATNAAYEALWAEILSCSVEVISTGAQDETAVQQDQADLSFDVEAFSEIYGLLVPALGAPRHSDELRRQFAKILYRYSMIHDPHLDDLPEPHQEPLAALSSRHVGRTEDIRQSARHRMGFKVLDALFDLVSDHGGSADYTRLAQAAAPYLILRTSLSIKTYVLDQPLRGRMPQPSSQRKELFYILHKLVALDSEPKAIPDKVGVSCKHKKHLYWVYGLVTQALAAAPADREMHEALTRVISTIAEDFEYDID